MIASTVIAFSMLAEAAPSSLSVHFQNYRNGHTYTNNNFRSDYKDVKFPGQIGNGQHKVVNFPSNSSYRRLRVALKRGQFGGSQNIIAASSLARSRTYTKKYSVRFANNWDFGRGGKLPGLGGGTTPAGGQPSTDGMTIRPMWRHDNYRNRRFTGSSRSYLEAYHYWRGQARAFFGGDDKRKSGDRTYLVSARKNVWYHFEIKSDIGNSTTRGRLQLEVNGVSKYNHQHQYFDRGDGWKLNLATTNFYYGGGDSSWGPNRDTNVFYDNVKINK